jgi:hypothetical protein
VTPLPAATEALADTCRCELYAGDDDAAWQRLHRELLRRLRETGVRRVVSVVRQDHAATLRRLAAAGYTERWRSWSARLDLRARPLTSLGRVTSAARVEPIGTAQAAEAHRLYTACAPDFPVTPATLPPAYTPDAFRALLDTGRAFAVRAPHPTDTGEDPRALRALTVLRVAGTHAETEVTVTDARWRRHGLATAVKRAAIEALAAEGVTTFGTGGAGGAQRNTAMLRANQRLGYVLDPPWLCYGYDL